MEKIKKFWGKNIFNKIVVIFIALIIIGGIGQALSDEELGDIESSSERTKLESKKEVTIIDFSNMAVNDIATWCETNKVECYIKDEYSDSVAKGSFVSQSVNINNKIYEEEEITIIYSLGKEPSLEFQNALRKGKQYLDTMAFSYKGLISQLEFEKYSYEAAVYAVDNCGADWSEQAYLKGKQYLDTMAFSRQGLIDQLKFEKFTDAEAKYAVNKLGL